MSPYYVGLINQGATCYLNSFIQTLFHLPTFRRLIYDIPITGNEDSAKSIPLNLQRLFYQMQFSGSSCSTVNLTKSFGWNSFNSFEQNDIEEFSRDLIDSLEEKMKGTKFENSIANLFRGRFRNRIRCKKIGYQTCKEEHFYDLPLVVKGFSNLSESLKSYISEEKLIGDNKYDTNTQYGKQDAVIDIKFIEFPPVLHILLKRFMFDVNKNKMTKLNDHFEFPETIDLTEYLADDSPQKKSSNIYDLYGVLVHSGNYSGGHYYAFLRTSIDQQWYKFNDSSVSKESVMNAVYNNFGNVGSNNRCYSGYMLIYCRREKVEMLFKPISIDSIPNHLKSNDGQEFHQKKSLKKTLPKNVVNNLNRKTLTIKNVTNYDVSNRKSNSAFSNKKPMVDNRNNNNRFQILSNSNDLDENESYTKQQIQNSFNDDDNDDKKKKKFSTKKIELLEQLLNKLLDVNNGVIDQVKVKAIAENVNEIYKSDKYDDMWINEKEYFYKRQMIPLEHIVKLRNYIYDVQ